MDCKYQKVCGHYDAHMCHEERLISRCKFGYWFGSSESAILKEAGKLEKKIEADKTLPDTNPDFYLL